MSQPIQLADRVKIYIRTGGVMEDMNGQLGLVKRIKSDARWPIGIQVDGRQDLLFFTEDELEIIYET